MKGNINKADGSGHWWACDIFCDDCGRQFQDHNTITSDYPDKNEKDYCNTCLPKYIHINEK